MSSAQTPETVQGSEQTSGTAQVQRQPVDFTVEELAARQKQPSASRKESTNLAYEKTRRKWWPKFLAAMEWRHEDAIVFLNDDGTVRDAIFRRLFVWLYEQDVTKGVFKPMLAWAQAELNSQLTAKMMSPKKEYVCNLPGVKERKDEIYAGARQCHMEHMVDLQAAVECDVGFDGMDKMVRCCLSMNVPQTSGLFCMQILFELRATHQAGARHDDLRGEVFAHLFTSFARRVGPNGMSMLCEVTDGGKTNKNGRISYSAVLPHRNPLFCTIFAKAALFLYRFVVMGAPFPDMLSPNDIFKRRVLRQAYDEFKGVSYDSSYAIMKRLYECTHVLCTKVLHQGRGECQRELDDDWCPLDQIKRLVKYVHDEQTDSYLLNPPMQALLSRAGFDHQNPSSACAAHLSAKMNEGLVELLLPKLALMEELIANKFAAAKSGEEAKKDRLFCARGCARAFRLLVQIFIRCAAARPRDAAGNIIMDSEPIYKLFFPHNRLFQLPFFSSSAFLAFSGAVSAAEQREMNVDVSMNQRDNEAPESTASLTPITARIDAAIARHINPLRASVSSLILRFDDASAQSSSTCAASVSSASASARTVISPVSNPNRGIHNAAAIAQAKRGANCEMPLYVLSTEKTSIAQLWMEYTSGIDGRPAVRSLEEKGKMWRRYTGGKEAWSDHSRVYEEIERRMNSGTSEIQAVQQVQDMMDTLCKVPRPGQRGRKPAAFPLKALAAQLRKLYPRQDIAVSMERKRARAAAMASRKQQRLCPDNQSHSAETLLQDD